MNPQQDIITTLRAQLSEARKTANELTDELTETRRELELLKSDDVLNTRILKQHAEQIAELQRERCELEEQLTAHKEVVEMCEGVITTALRNNGGVIGFDSTTDGKEYVMVLSEDFKELELAFTTIAKLKEVGCE